MTQFIFRILSLFILAFVAGCQSNQSIVNSIDEREANEIVVFLASKGIAAQKVQAPSSAIGGTSTIELYSISVSADQATEAMSLLNRNGLPRPQGTTLLQLFAKSGLMSSDREETIRYQSGQREELKNAIRKIDGVLDADVQISFPPADTTALPGATPPKVTAAVYIKHQGIMEDPNSHLEVKIKRLLAGSINNLDYENIAVISDRSRIADINLQSDGEMIGPKALQQTYVSIWGLILTKTSLARFRFIFFSFILAFLLLCGAIGWMIYKFYPLMRMKRTETPPETTHPEIKP
ncbi:MAG: type III secretion inner membrane ring lipoprotein SctJ [Chlamydiota bacterium]